MNDATEVGELTDLEVVIAYIRDRAEQYDNSSACRVALENIARDLHNGAHIEACRHGELDDLLKNPLR